MLMGSVSLYFKYDVKHRTCCIFVVSPGIYKAARSTIMVNDVWCYDLTNSDRKVLEIKLQI